MVVDQVLDEFLPATDLIRLCPFCGNVAQGDQVELAAFEALSGAVAKTRIAAFQH